MSPLPVVEKTLMITYSADVANREQRERTGSKGTEQGAKGSEGSESISILCFRVPTTCGGKNFDDHI